MSGRFAITIDGVEHLLSDPLVKGRDLLEIAGRIPVDEHLLFYRQGDGLLEDINLAEEIDLRASGKEEFSSVKADRLFRSEEHTSELQSLMRISYAVFCLK